MIKILCFTGPGSFALFLAVGGDAVVPSVRWVRCFDHGEIVCFVDLGGLTANGRGIVSAAVQAAHAMEPIKLDHDVDMSPTVISFIAEKLSGS